MNLLPIMAELRVLMVRRDQLGRKWANSGRTDPFARLYFVESGRGWVRHQGRTYDLTPGSVHLIPQETLLSFGCPRRVTIFWSHFLLSTLAGMDALEGLIDRYATRIEDEVVLPCLQRLLALHEVPGYAAEQERLGLFLQMLAWFAPKVRRQSDENAARAMRFSSALSYIDEHLGERIVVGDLARCVGLEATYFTALFTRTFGLPPARYLLKRRVEAGRRLLLETDKTVDAIARDTGFCDAFHFSKSFKRIVGIPPTAFRNRPITTMP